MGSSVGITKAGTANVDVLSGSWPGGVAAGDIAIMPWTFINTATPIDPTQDAMSLVADTIDGSCRQRLLRRYCDGSETGTISVSTAPTFNRQTWILAVFRGYDFISGFKVKQETVSGTTHTPPQITTADGYNGNTPADGDDIVIISSTRDGTTVSITATSPYAIRTDGEIGIVGSGGTHTAVADDGLTQSVTLPHTPGAFTSYDVSSGTAVITTLALRPTASGITGTMTLTTPTGSVTLSAGARSSGDIAAAIASPSLSAAAVGRLTSSLSAQVPAVSYSSSGTARAQSSIIGAIASPSANVLGESTAVGSLSPPVQGPTVLAAATARSEATLTAVAAVALVTAVGEAVTDSSSLALTSPAVGFTADGRTVNYAVIAGQTTPATLTGAGDAAASADLSATLPAPTLNISGEISTPGGLTLIGPTAVAGLAGDSTSSGDVVGQLAPAAMSMAGTVEVPSTPTGALDLTIASPEVQASGHLRAAGGLTPSTSSPTVVLGGEAKASGGLGGAPPGPSMVGQAEASSQAEVACTPSTPTMVVEGHVGPTMGPSGSLTLSITAPAVEFEGVVESPATQGSLDLVVGGIGVEIHSSPPAFSVSSLIEADNLRVEVLETWAVMVEEDLIDTLTDEQLHTYVESDRLEVTVG